MFTRFSRAIAATAVLTLAGAMAVPAHAASTGPEQPTRLVSLTAEGGDFRALLSNGAVLHGADLVGATIAGAGDLPMTLRIDTAERDAGGHAPDVWLFGLVAMQPDGSTTPFCEPDPSGRRLAIPYAAPGQPLALTCSAGAVGKCLRFGYRPWSDAPDGTPLAPLHAACVRMVRADYGGNDHPWTRNGMRIDVYDNHGIQHPDTADQMPFEAGWGPDGAVCVAHPRVPENGGLADIVAGSPRLAGRTGAEACTEDKARALGAVLFNRSAGG